MPPLNDYQTEMTRVTQLDQANIKRYEDAVAKLKSGAEDPARIRKGHPAADPRSMERGA
jgi:hypothetical protein